MHKDHELGPFDYFRGIPGHCRSPRNVLEDRLGRAICKCGDSQDIPIPFGDTRTILNTTCNKSRSYSWYDNNSTRPTFYAVDPALHCWIIGCFPGVVETHLQTFHLSLASAQSFSGRIRTIKLGRAQMPTHFSRSSSYSLEMIMFRDSEDKSWILPAWVDWLA